MEAGSSPGPFPCHFLKGKQPFKLDQTRDTELRKLDHDQIMNIFFPLIPAENLISPNYIPLDKVGHSISVLVVDSTLKKKDSDSQEYNVVTVLVATEKKGSKKQNNAYPDAILVQVLSVLFSLFFFFF